MTTTLILGGGGTRGIAHTGVLQALKEEQVEVDNIYGSSIGSVVAGLYALGTPPKKIYEHLKNAKIKNVFGWPRFKDGLILGERVEEYLTSLFGEKTFEDLERRLVVNALDINSKEVVYFEKGKLKDVIRASMSIPGLYSPKRINGRTFVDAGIIDQVPTHHVPASRNCIISDVSGGDKQLTEDASFIDVFRKYLYITQDRLKQPNIQGLRERPDIDNLIEVVPDTYSWYMFDMRNYEALFEEGYQAMKREL